MFKQFSLHWNLLLSHELLLCTFLVMPFYATCGFEITENEEKHHSKINWHQCRMSTKSSLQRFSVKNILSYVCNYVYTLATGERSLYLLILQSRSIAQLVSPLETFVFRIHSRLSLWIISKLLDVCWSWYVRKTVAYSGIFWVLTLKT